MDIDLSFITRFFKYEWITYPLFTLTVIFSVNYWIDRVLRTVSERSTKRRSEILLHMKMLGMAVDEKKVSQLMIMSSLGVGFLFFMLAWPEFSVGIVLGISAAIAGFQLPPIVLKSMYEKRCSVFVDQMVDALTIMANGVKSGSNPQQAMQRVVEIMGNPVSSEFGQVITQTQFGQSFEEALNDLGERIPRPDVQMFVTAINILKETGGNMSETFETIVTTIRERQKLEKKIAAMTAQGVMQGIIVTCIPFALLAVFYFIDPSYIKPLFTTALGLVFLFAMLALQIIGGLMIKKIVTIKV